MSNNKQQQQPTKLHTLSILRMLWKRKWLACSFWILASVAVAVIVQALPSVYKAEAVVLVDSQKIPESFVSSTVNGDITDRLALISQDIMSSDRLLDITAKFKLYQRERSQEELLRKMRQDISVNVEKSWTGGRMQAFRLGYQGSDPKVVAEVANRLAGLYVAENLRARKDQAEGTVNFLHRQLQQAKKGLDEQEAKISQFKQEHNGALPQQENSLLGTLSSLNVELQGVQQSIGRSQDNRISLESSLASAETAEAALKATLQASAKGVPQTPVDGGKPPQTRSAMLQDQLRMLRLKYTEDHPAVQAVQREMEEARRQELEAFAAGQLAYAGALKSGQKRDPQDSGQESVIVTPELLHARERITVLRNQVQAEKRTMESLERQKEQLLAAISDSQSRISRLPLVEQQMASLKRDYEESASNYNSLLQKELAAGVATDMERTEKSERFTVVDRARVPQKPVKPKRAVLAGAGSVLALALGFAIGFLLEFRKQTLLGEWELPPGTVVLGRVPVIPLASSSAMNPWWCPAWLFSGDSR